MKRMPKPSEKKRYVFAREKTGLTFDFPLVPFIFCSVPFIFVFCFIFLQPFLQIFPFMFLSCLLVSHHVVFMFLQLLLSCFFRVTLDSRIWKLKNRHPRDAIFVHSCRRFILTQQKCQENKLRYWYLPGPCSLFLWCLKLFLCFFSNHKGTTNEYNINTSFPVVFC